MKKKIFFNKPFINKAARHNILKVIKNMNFIDGIFQKKCENYIKKKIKSSSVKLTNSCTSALEIAMILINLKKGDEVIIPAHTYCASAIPFARQGAQIIWSDINFYTRVVDINDIIKKINSKTKAILIVHLYGFACDFRKLINICKKKK